MNDFILFCSDYYWDLSVVLAAGIAVLSYQLFSGLRTMKQLIPLVLVVFVMGVGFSLASILDASEIRALRNVASLQTVFASGETPCLSYYRPGSLFQAPLHAELCGYEVRGERVLNVLNGEFYSLKYCTLKGEGE